MPRSRTATIVTVAVLLAAALGSWRFIHRSMVGGAAVGGAAGMVRPGMGAANSSGNTSPSARGIGAGGLDAGPVESILTVEQVQHQDEKIALGLSPRPEGLQVTEVLPGTVVERLALKPGDVIRSMNGQRLSSLTEFVQIYKAHGLPIPVEIERDGLVLHRH